MQTSPGSTAEDREAFLQSTRHEYLSAVKRLLLSMPADKRPAAFAVLNRDGLLSDAMADEALDRAEDEALAGLLDGCDYGSCTN